MAEWSKDKVNPTNINGGREFTTNDDLAVNELNAMVNNSFYAVDFAEAMADAPDVSEINGTGTPSVSFVNNVKNGKVFKKLKFSNLKGSKGDTGEKGEKGDKGDTGDTVPNTLAIGSVVGGETASATITGTAPNQVLNLVLPKGEKGDKGDTGETGGIAEPVRLGTFSKLSTTDKLITLPKEITNYKCFIIVTGSSHSYGWHTMLHRLNSKTNGDKMTGSFGTQISTANGVTSIYNLRVVLTVASSTSMNIRLSTSTKLDISGSNISYTTQYAPTMGEGEVWAY